MLRSKLHRAALPLAALSLFVAAPALAQSDDGTGGIGTDPTGPTAPADPGGDAKSGGVFPIKGAHTYGDGIGAGRGHQGQDLLAKCGKPIVAAQAGKVRFVDYQASGAGNYVVIKSKETKFDYVYMHMERKATVSRGDTVDAGQQLGTVGTTGRSTACHLHFEMWTKPGWYRGGKVTSPKPYLKAWDRSS